MDVNQYDVVVFDGYAPDVLPRGNVLIISPSESALFTIEGEVRQPKIRGWERDDPLLRFVDLRDVAIARSFRVVPPAGCAA